MAPLPTIADVFRVSFEFTNGSGQTSVNVLHFRNSGTASEVAAAINSVLDNSGSYNPWTALSTAFECSTINIIPLDGVSAGQDFTISPAISGDAAGDAIPNCAMVVSFHTGTRGSRGRGRIFIGPIAEGNQGDGFFLDSYISGVSSQWESFISDLNAQSTPVDLVVASYKHADAHVVTSHRVDRKIGTQRRRLERL